jgi:SHS family lactate transporter-like MFS transporter
MHDVPSTPPPASGLPWYREVNRGQWRAFWATFLGWALDGFDFTILTFVIIDIQDSFTVDRALAGALGTITLFMRLLGGVLAGSAADRWGRKLPLALSILWFSIFAFLSGFSTSYAMLFGLRALFGIGMGGEWAAGMPLVLEHWPAHLRGIASGLLQGGFAWGYILSAATFQYIYPLFSATPDLAWRAMFWVAIAPALLTLWIRAKVSESPVWLARQRASAGHADDRARAGPPSSSWPIVRIFARDLIGPTLQSTVLMAGFMCSYYSITYWYATFLIEAGRPTFGPIVALNLGGIVGTATWGRLSETRLGRRGAASVAATLGIAMIPLFLTTGSTAALWLGALLMGACGHGAWGIVPSYLSERFPTAVRGTGVGFVYHAGAALGSVTPTVLGSLQDRGVALADTMMLGIGLSGLLIILMIWLGPETRGRTLEGKVTS